MNKNQYYEFQLNKACFGTVQYYKKSYFITVGALASNTEMAVGTTACGYNTCIVNTTDRTDTPYLIGTISNSLTTKGFYYLDDYMVSSATYFYTCSLTANSYYTWCPWYSYSSFIDYNSYESLKRF